MAPANKGKKGKKQKEALSAFSKFGKTGNGEDLFQFLKPIRNINFDDKSALVSLMKKHAGACIAHMNSSVFNVDVPEMARSASFYPNIEKDVGAKVDIPLLRKLGEGSYGAVYALGGPARGVVVKIITFASERYTHRTPYAEWLVNVLAEATLLRIFAVSQVGPNVPEHNVAMDLNRKTAYLFIKKADGDLHSLATRLDARNQYTPDVKRQFESQLRRLVTLAIKMGVVCVDVKPENVLYNTNPTTGKFILHLSDFDKRFCCSLVDSIAGDALVRVNVSMFAKWLQGWKGRVIRLRKQDGSTETLKESENKGREVSLLPSYIQDFLGSVKVSETPCPLVDPEVEEMSIALTLAFFGGALGMFRREFDIAVAYLEDPSNSKDSLYNMFQTKWGDYKMFFIEGWRLPNWPYPDEDDYDSYDS